MDVNRMRYGAPLVFAMALCSCNITGKCQNVPQYRSANPTGIFDVVVFNRNCGATSGNNIQISIVNHNDSIDDYVSGNVLSAFGVSYTEGIKPNWSSKNSINIFIYRSSRIAKKKSYLNGVTISYKYIDDAAL